MPAGVAQLVITSPPYNIGKAYERRRSLEEYLAEQQRVIAECVRILRPGGASAGRSGTTCATGRRPLDLVLHPLFAHHEELVLRNRIVWHFAHGLHCRRRFRDATR
jgi:adenine-specific DNA-methyltransferase